MNWYLVRMWYREMVIYLGFMTYENFLERDMARIAEMIQYETNQIVIREYEKHMKQKNQHDGCVRSSCCLIIDCIRTISLYN